MVACEHCGAECTLPFTCQHCGGKFCPDCRLPPNHSCPGMGSWNRKPRPSIGINYGKGGSASVTGGGYSPASGRASTEKRGAGIPYLTIMTIIIVLILAGLAWLALTGYRL